MPRASQTRPIGSQAQELQQMPGPNFELIVTALAAAPMPVDLKMVLNAALTAANPVISGIFDAAGNRMPAMDVAARPGFVDLIDRAARLVGIVYGEAAQLQQLTPVDAMAPNLSLEAISFLSVYDAIDDEWNRAREGAVIGSLLTDPADRAARLLGVVYGDLAALQQIAAPGDALVPANTLESTGLLYVYNGATWDMVREGVAAGSILTDLSDRPTRQGGLFQLTDYTNNGIVNPDGSIPVAPAKVTIQSFESLVGATAEGAAANLALNTDHRGAGASSLEFDKVAGNILAGVSYAIAALDLSLYSTHSEVAFFAYVPTPVGGNIVQVYAALGTDNANLFFWAIPAADLILDAWNHIHLNMMDVSGVLGVGANLSAVTYCAIYVQTSVAGATIANMLVDQLTVKRTFEVQVTNQLATLNSDGLNPMHVVASGVFPYVYDPVADDWNRVREGATVGSVMTEDTGLNTNPELYKVNNGFRSDVIDRAGAVATALYTGATTPARVGSVYLYWIRMYNHSGGAATAWLEIGGTPVTITYSLDDGQTVSDDFPVPLPLGANDILCNASANDVEFQIGGYDI